MRTDRYEVGDKVEFRDDLEHSRHSAERFKKKWGVGPYVVDKVTLTSDPELAGHQQHVLLNNEPFSGWWFKPLR